MQKDQRQINPIVRVGIMSVPSLRLNLNGVYEVGERNVRVTGPLEASCSDGRVVVGDMSAPILTFRPLASSCTADVEDVTIGVNFHWERKERQTFAGAVTLRAVDGEVLLINEIDVEEYLRSVISSEMSATSSAPLLRAHAVISRSWLLAQIYRDMRHDGSLDSAADSAVATSEELIKWYDHDDHTLFDVCADDHCQRYQGVSRITSPEVDAAIADTRGLVLMENDRICDARFSKCCGGVMEEFQNCWEPRRHPYLVARRDVALDPSRVPDLRVERNAVEWITSRPDAFCNTTDPAVLSQVLNNYDQETTDFFRWTVSYRADELGRLIASRSGIDFGDILDLTPLSRGTSGRITRLHITGTLRSMIVGKELEIRRWLSTSHLYSSAFVVEKTEGDSVASARFILRGAGWGHGVGLCQIGAAVMGAQGYDYAEILAHYFPGSTLQKLYH